MAISHLTRIGLIGANGRMGRFVTNLCQGDYAHRVVLAAQASSGDALDPLLEVETLIDFSSPEAMVDLIDRALVSSKPLPAFVVGSTGWNGDQLKKLDQLASKTAVLRASNFSTGVTALIQILEQASPILKKLGYTPVITETHHHHKKDAPSGTALSLAKSVTTNGEPPQTHSIRAGEVIGDHEVRFFGPADQLSFSHHAQDRSLFARGAIDVAIWLASCRQNPGFKHMKDFLCLN